MVQTGVFLLINVKSLTVSKKPGMGARTMQCKPPKVSMESAFFTVFACFSDG